jgi:hypothetical protein
VVIDLVAQGWLITATEPEVAITFTNGISPELEKERIRRVHLMDRDAQLREASVSVFIKGMEKKRLTPKGWHSIFSLMRDGEQLASNLAAAGSAKDRKSQTELLGRAISPYIQFVEPDGTSGSLPMATALGTTQSLVSVDDLQEFRVHSSSYSAEYGLSPGGQFTFETRSGTNDAHGTLFDYLRNDALDANNWFNDHTTPITAKPAE